MTSDPVCTSCFSRSEIEEIVVTVRLSLYNYGPHCGPQAIRAELDRNSMRPLPSTSTIKRILSRNCLTHSRTGYYPQDDGAQCL
jgi:putative transposase